MTSFQVVKKIREHFQIKKVGHAGTLDPFATGVLVILTGKATKKSVEIMQLEKEYLVEMELGKETDTDDIDGRVIKQSEKYQSLSRQEIDEVLTGFIGSIEQVPPRYAAIKHKGKPLYKYARKGIELTPKPREVFIKSISLLDLKLPCLILNVICSKGTYIRSLARDIGRKLGTYGYVKTLQRTKVGPYTIQDAIELGDFLK